MKKILITSYDLEVGGVERSLINMLTHFDYNSYQVDLLLFSHTGDFIEYLPENVTLLKEHHKYATFRKSILEMVRDKQWLLSVPRLVAKGLAFLRGHLKRTSEPGYFQMQLMWRYSIPFLPKVTKEYDIAISYLWPHDFVAKKVKAKKKLAWIHTDYSSIDTHVKMDEKIWTHFDHIVAVSENCRSSFLTKYKGLSRNVVVVENILSPDFIQRMAIEKVENPMIEDQRFKMITVARLSYPKGIDQAIEAMKILKSKGYTELVWYVVGYGAIEAELKELIAQAQLEDCFILLGKQINPYPFIAAGNMYIQPSRYEGKAVTVSEAQILGKAVIVTNYSTARSQVSDGDDGIICELNVKDIASMIEKVYTDERTRHNLERNCRRKNYHNNEELIKLYKLFNEEEHVLKERKWEVI
ncbi:glycosyltransferase [Alkalihalobacillus pseudalcaliphilus]|uniref:glycosyltransferase n=1 Tax=Alkalihalobacillus pseudalcaliphilus TaxID=79884 RepID=UPI00064DAB70|nr:glycosyltransferase [Alkalihalobacillus pseudalcaliphilus]KMK75035.1 capsular biosynthesis protein [Alkalihalobacillus pseudalcaliphilus]